VIRVQLFDREGKRVLSESCRVEHLATVASLLGLTAVLSPKETTAQRRKSVERGVSEPQAALKGAQLSAAGDSPYALELLVPRAGKAEPRELKLDEGLAMADVKREETFQIRIVNESAFDAAVLLTIDGLSVFAFSENPAFRRAGWLIIPARSSAVISGWHRTPQRTDPFTVHRYAGSAAAAFDPKSLEIGTITAVFAAAWPTGDRPPPDEPRDPHASEGTGVGSSGTTAFKELERQTGVPRAVVSIRYHR
jgi:hypothetical protein